MLNIKHKSRLQLPTFSSERLAFSPVRAESDELIEAIEQRGDDDNWTLDERPDPAALQAYLQNALADTALTEFSD